MGRPRTDTVTGSGNRLIGCSCGGTHGYTRLDYNGVLFGEGALCALASFAQMQALDLAAASSAGPTATRYWTTTA